MKCLQKNKTIQTSRQYTNNPETKKEREGGREGGKEREREDVITHTINDIQYCQIIKTKLNHKYCKYN